MPSERHTRQQDIKCLFRWHTGQPCLCKFTVYLIKEIKENSYLECTVCKADSTSESEGSICMGVWQLYQPGQTYRIHVQVVPLDCTQQEKTMDAWTTFSTYIRLCVILMQALSIKGYQVKIGRFKDTL